MSPIAGRIDRRALRDLRDTVQIGSLEIDRAPVTNARYRTFVAATGHRAPAHWPRGHCPAALLEHPVVGIDFFDAIAFARWAGGALPTEEEWLMANGLYRPFAYVWGDVFEPDRCNTAQKGPGRTTPVGAYEAGVAPSGCVDLCGNVWELTCTALPQDQDAVVVKGGSWRDSPAHARLDARFRTPVNKESSTVGFRLVYGVPDTLPHFLTRKLVDRCLFFRTGAANAPAIEEGPDRTKECEDTLRELRETAAKHIARLAEEPAPPAHATVEEALAIFDQLAAEVMPVPERWQRRPGVHPSKAVPAATVAARRGRLAAAAREIGRATFWRRILPVLKALLLPARGGPGRLAGAWHEIQAPRDGPSLCRSVGNALCALLFPSLLDARPANGWDAPDPGPALLDPRPAARPTVTRPALPRVRLPERSVAPPAPPPRTDRASRRETVAVSRAPAPATPSRAMAILATHPRMLFVGACISIGTFLVLLGSDGGTDGHGSSEETAAAAPEAPAAETRADAVDVPEDELDEAMRAILEGTLGDRVEAEGTLISFGMGALPRVEEALATQLPPDARMSLRYVATALEEASASEPARPYLTDAPPERGIILFCDSLDGEGLDSVHMVRCTARAAGVPATVVLSAGPNSAQLADRYAAELGDVDVYVDGAGVFARQMRIARLPAVAGLDQRGTVAFLLMGHARRDRLAENIFRLLR